MPVASACRHRTVVLKLRSLPAALLCMRRLSPSPRPPVRRRRSSPANRRRVAPPRPWRPRSRLQPPSPAPAPSSRVGGLLAAAARRTRRPRRRAAVAEPPGSASASDASAWRSAPPSPGSWPWSPSRSSGPGRPRGRFGASLPTCRLRIPQVGMRISARRSRRRWRCPAPPRLKFGIGTSCRYPPAGAASLSRTLGTPWRWVCSSPRGLGLGAWQRSLRTAT
mmetsp:Transcript_173898/g.557377  ORF Transcript_173898/g.557377 Transcript_173898/m.557377 type:complete len:222 (-) Transcript_173898:783-1448(-)